LEYIWTQFPTKSWLKHTIKQSNSHYNQTHSSGRHNTKEIFILTSILILQILCHILAITDCSANDSNMYHIRCKPEIYIV
jgi:hypothetical protein